MVVMMDDGDDNLKIVVMKVTMAWSFSQPQSTLTRIPALHITLSSTHTPSLGLPHLGGDHDLWDLHLVIELGMPPCTGCFFSLVPP